MDGETKITVQLVGTHEESKIEGGSHSHFYPEKLFFSRRTKNIFLFVVVALRVKSKTSHKDNIAAGDM